MKRYGYPYIFIIIHHLCLTNVHVEHVICDFYIIVDAKYEEWKCGSCGTATMAQNVIMCDKCLVWFHW